MCHVDTGFSDPLDLEFIQFGHVYRNQVGVQQVQLVESLQRTLAVFLLGLGHFCRGLMHMHVHRNIEFVTVHRDLAQRFV